MIENHTDFNEWMDAFIDVRYLLMLMGIRLECEVKRNTFSIAELKGKVNK